MAFSPLNGQKSGIVPEGRIGFFHHFGMVEGDGADEHGEGRQSHHDAVVVVGAETNWGILQFRQFGLHGSDPVGLFEMQVVKACEVSLHTQPCTSSSKRWIEIGVVEEIKVKRVFLEWDFSQNDVFAFRKSSHTQLSHPFGDDDVALKACRRPTQTLQSYLTILTKCRHLVPI